MSKVGPFSKGNFARKFYKGLGGGVRCASVGRLVQIYSMYHTLYESTFPFTCLFCAKAFSKQSFVYNCGFFPSSM